MEAWITVFIGFCTTVAAAFLSARWATKKALNEKWWDRKIHAYTELIEALHDLIRYTDLCAQDYLNNEEEDHPKKEEFGQKYSEAYWAIERATDIGAFVMSSEVTDVLSKLRLRKRLEWKNNPPWEIYEEEAKHFREALSEIRKFALNDLKIKG